MLEKLARERGIDKTFCPSEAAKQVAPGHWRDIMDEVRQVASELVHEKKLLVTQGGKVKDPATTSGPIRYNKPG